MAEEEKQSEWEKNIPTPEEAAEVNSPTYQPNRLSRFSRWLTSPWGNAAIGISTATAAAMSAPTEIHAEAVQPSKPTSPVINPGLFDWDQSSPHSSESLIQFGPTKVSSGPTSPKEIRKQEESSYKKPILVDLTKKGPIEVINYDPSEAIQVVLPPELLQGDLEADATLGQHSVILLDPGQYYKDQLHMTDEEFQKMISDLKTEEEIHNFLSSRMLMANPQANNDKWSEDDPQFNIRIFNPKEPKNPGLTIPVKVTRPHGI